MRDVRRDVRVASDRDLLVDRRQQPDGIARFIADMAVVIAAALARFGRERDHFVGLGKALRRVEQAGRKPDRAFAHRGRDHRLHPREFGRRRRALGLADHRLPDRAEARKGRIIDPDRLGLRTIQHRADIDRAAAVIANERGGHTLQQEHRDQPLGRVLRQQIVAHMRVRVDEAGGDDHAPRIDHAFGKDVDRGPRPYDRLVLKRYIAKERGGKPFGIADNFDDMIAPHCDIADKGVVRAGVDRAAADQQIDLWLRHGRCTQKQQRDSGQKHALH